MDIKCNKCNSINIFVSDSDIKYFPFKQRAIGRTIKFDKVKKEPVYKYVCVSCSNKF